MATSLTQSAAHPFEQAQITHPDERLQRLRALAVATARLLALCMQLALVALVLSVWQIDKRAFRYQFALICAGFVIHHLLPTRMRLPFFGVFSLALIVVLMGINGLYVIGLGALLIGVVHLPFRLWMRVALLVALGIGLGWLRAYGTLPELHAILPILAGLFMFRLLIYVYDLQTGAAKGELWSTLAYFFMAPNACFTLFPIVDYKTFLRTRYNRDAFEIYQKGVDWIVRGVIQLILYRFVYQNLVIDTHHVANARDAAQYILANFLLYLRVSGNFHLIVGLLHLFGFNLSETHHRYLLASSFTDFWRRINIYWKDFIQKLFFYPIYFRLKRRGELFGLLAATALAFFATWCLHSYQFFWLSGHFLVTWQDIAFWTILGVGVVLNVAYEARATRKRKLTKGSRTWRDEFAFALRTIAMFTFICLLWSLWNTPSWHEWTSLLSKFAVMSPIDAVLIFGGLALFGVAAVLWGHSSSERTDAPRQRRNEAADAEFWRSALVTGALSAALFIVGRNPLLFADYPQVANALDRLTRQTLNAQDVAKLERGYYEDLIDQDRNNAELAELYAARPQDWNAATFEYDRPDNKFPNWEYIPRLSHTQGHFRQSNNRHGMRDQEYPLERTPGVLRIAILGDSNTAGHHVSDQHVFEQLVEARLNAEFGTPQRPACELMNFAVPSYGPYARLHCLKNKVLAFKPDVAIFFGVNDQEWVLRDIARCLARELPLPDLFVRQIVEEYQLRSGDGARVVEHQLQGRSQELVGWVYGQTIEQCRAAGIRPIYAFLPRLDDRSWELEQLPELIAAAEATGFTVWDLTRAYHGVRDWNELWVETWDSHPGPRGHELIADRLYEKLRPLVAAPTVSAIP
ncbi:MAG: SGNH/GDSL hydrolase family protein [Pirellulales bacterium]|nr:SGNH/GDSL hydrolase family protein [Pirellulales bacterium]